MSKIPVAFNAVPFFLQPGLQPDVFIFVLLYLSKMFQAFYNWDQFESGHMYSYASLILPLWITFDILRASEMNKDTESSLNNLLVLVLCHSIKKCN